MEEIKITTENCLSLIRDGLSYTEIQARCWEIIFNLCYQNGLDVMDKKYDGLTGIEKTVKFIIEKFEQAKTNQSL